MGYELMPAFKIMDYFRKDLNSYKPKSMRDVNDAIIVSARKGFDHTIITVDKSSVGYFIDEIKSKGFDVDKIGKNDMLDIKWDKFVMRQMEDKY